MVYEYVVGRHRSSQTPIFTHVQKYVPKTLRASHQLIGLLSTTRGLCDEALHALYAQNTFHVTIGQHALLRRWIYPWAPKSVTNLTIELSQWYHGYPINIWPGGNDAHARLERVRWGGLRRLTKLRSLRLFISLVFLSYLRSLGAFQ